MVNIFAQATNNVLVYVFIITSEYVTLEFVMNEKELLVLDIQFGMQMVQLLCVLILMFTPLRTDRSNMCWHKGGPVIHWCLAQITFLIIPICSIIYWIVEF